MAVEVLEGLKRKATFTINKSIVQSLVKKELNKYAKEAKAPGFRPGKVPSHIVEQMYGGKAYEDALNTQINKEFVNIIIENKIDVVGHPEFDISNQEDKEAEEFVFSAIFEVMPVVTIGDLTTVTVEKPVCEFDDSNVDKTIDSLRKQRCTYEPGKEKAENGDKVTIDFVGSVDGVEFEGGKAEDYHFVLGQGYMLPDFEAGVEGMTAGETREVKVNFPESYQAENLKGKLAVFNITLKKVEGAQLPELTDEFIKSIGVDNGSIETLKKGIKENLTREMKRRLHVKTRENVLKALSDSSPLEVPYVLVHDEIHHMMDNTRENMKKQGYPDDQIKLTHDMFKQDAKRLVTLRMLVQQYIKDNNLSVNDDDVKKVVEDLSVSYDEPENYIKWYFEDQTRVNNARAIAMENKVLDCILAVTKASNVDIAYEELMKLPL